MNSLLSLKQSDFLLLMKDLSIKQIGDFITFYLDTDNVITEEQVKGYVDGKYAIKIPQNPSMQWCLCKLVTIYFLGSNKIEKADELQRQLIVKYDKMSEER